MHTDAFVESQMVSAYAAFLLAHAAFLSTQPLPRGSSQHRTLDTFGSAKGSVSRAMPPFSAKMCREPSLPLGKDVSRAHFGPRHGRAVSVF
jgi:hypothetical protein